jgi:hypothetical protein
MLSTALPQANECQYRPPHTTGDLILRLLSTWRLRPAVLPLVFQVQDARRCYKVPAPGIVTYKASFKQPINQIRLNMQHCINTQRRHQFTPRLSSLPDVSVASVFEKDLQINRNRGVEQNRNVSCTQTTRVYRAHKTANVRTNITLRRVRVHIVGVEYKY